MYTKQSYLSVRLAVLTPAVFVASLSGLCAGPMMAPAPLGPTLIAEPSGIEAEFHVGYSSDYIFRGGRLGGDLFEFGLDFAGAGDLPLLGEVNWSAGMWYASYDYNGIDYDVSGAPIGTFNSSLNELDVYGEVSKPIGDIFSVAVGITNYSYFGNGNFGGTNDDIEPYISIGADFWGISFGAAAYLDGANNYAHDFYYELSAGYEHELMENLSGGLELVLGIFDESNVSASDDSDIYFGATASLSYAVSKHITLSPYASLTFSDNLGDYFFGGVSLGFGF